MTTRQKTIRNIVLIMLFLGYLAALTIVYKTHLLSHRQWQWIKLSGFTLAFLLSLQQSLRARSDPHTPRILLLGLPAVWLLCVVLSGRSMFAP